ncbi:MAG TPA: Fic family protein [Candidatus Paceibacterota bacterium]|nr:Fic family protein [Candidatus Paceibacterota bacterium]
MSLTYHSNRIEGSTLSENETAAIHARFEQVHPFAGGNGRLGRLIMHAMALRVNLPPPVIVQEKRRLYISYLNKAKTKDDASLLADFICDAILDGYRIVERR